MKRFRQILAVVLLVVILIIGIGQTKLVSMVDPGVSNETQTHTNIPLLLLGLIITAALALLDVIPKEKSPQSLLPAIAIGFVLTIVTKTPIMWLNYTHTAWLVPLAGVVVLTTLCWQCIEGILRNSHSGDGAAFSSSIAIRTSLIMLAACAPSLLQWIAHLIHQQASYGLDGTWASPIYFGVQLLITAAGGIVGLYMVQKGCRKSGLTLLIIGAVGIVVNLFLMHRGGFLLGDNMSSIAKAIYDSQQNLNTLSLASFCLFAGIGAMKKPKAS